MILKGEEEPPAVSSDAIWEKKETSKQKTTECHSVNQVSNNSVFCATCIFLERKIAIRGQEKESLNNTNNT